MKKENIIVKFWNTTWPLIIYSLAQVITTALGTIVLLIVTTLQNANKDGMASMDDILNGLEPLTMKWTLVFILAAAIICIPVYYHMIKKDRLKAGEEKRSIPMTNKDYFAIILAGASFALAANNVISLTPLPVWFPGYEEVNEAIFAGGIVLQILSAGMFCCVVEELALRGITYLRAKRYWGRKKAMIFSAVIFGIYHMNVVQGVYAFLMGLLLAWLYERYQTLWAPIIAHMSANIFVTLLAENTFFNKTLETLVGYCLLTCISLLVLYYSWRFMKQSDPRVELVFEEKEPDTLEKLTEEYKEHENR